MDARRARYFAVAAFVGALFCLFVSLGARARVSAELQLTSPAHSRVPPGANGFSLVSVARSSDIQGTPVRGESCMRFPNVMAPTSFTSDTNINIQYLKKGELTQSLPMSSCTVTFFDALSRNITEPLVIPNCLSNSNSSGSGNFSVRPPFAVFGQNVTLHVAAKLCRPASGDAVECEYYDVCQAVSLELGAFQFRAKSFLHDYARYYEEAYRVGRVRRFGEYFNPMAPSAPMPSLSVAGGPTGSMKNVSQDLKTASLLSNVAPILGDLATAPRALRCPVDLSDTFACSRDGLTLLQCVDSEWLGTTLPVDAVCRVGSDGVAVISDGQEKTPEEVLELVANVDTTGLPCPNNQYACSGDGGALLRCAEGAWRQLQMPGSSWCEFVDNGIVVLDAVQVATRGSVNSGNIGGTSGVSAVKAFGPIVSDALEYALLSNDTKQPPTCTAEQAGALACSGDGRVVLRCNAANKTWMSLQMPPDVSCVSYDRATIDAMFVAPIVSAVAGSPGGSAGAPQLLPVALSSGCSAENYGMFACSESGRVLLVCGSALKWEVVSMLPSQVCGIVRKSVVVANNGAQR